MVTTSRADYGRLKPVMEQIRKHPGLALQVVAGSSLFLDHFFWFLRHGEPVSFWRSLPWYIRARRVALFGSAEETYALEELTRFLARDGFRVDARVPLFLHGQNLRTMVKTSGLAMLGMPRIFETLRPDIVLLHGDRFEILPVASAAAFSNIPVAHIEGGDVSGTIDNSVRHAVTKLAHIHFPVTKKSRDRLVAMGEDPRVIFLTGSPLIDFLQSFDREIDNRIYKIYGPGRGAEIDVTKPFILVVQHPVTTEYEANYRNTKELIAALNLLKHPTLFVAPNIDAGADGVGVAIREYSETRPHEVAFFKYFSPEDFCRVLNRAAVAVGNSSSFLREGAYLGTPAVLVGNRQEGRERAENVVEVGNRADEIRDAIRAQLDHGRYPASALFGDGNAALRITETLASIDLKNFSAQKRFYENP